jgi:hypothetical protein
MSGATGNMRLRGGIFLKKGVMIYVQNEGSIEVDDSDKRNFFFPTRPNIKLNVGAIGKVDVFL